MRTLSFAVTPSCVDELTSGGLVQDCEALRGVLAGVERVSLMHPPDVPHQVISDVVLNNLPLSVRSKVVIKMDPLFESEN